MRRAAPRPTRCRACLSRSRRWPKRCAAPASRPEVHACITPIGDRKPMSWLSEFVRPKIRTLFTRREVPDNLWHQCPSCQQMIFQKDMIANQRVCLHCGFHMRATAAERLEWLFDEGYTRIE